MTTGDDLRAKRLQDARDTIARIKRAQFELMPARLSMALAPFGLAVEVTKTTDKVGFADLRLASRGRGRPLGKKVGFAAWHELDLLLIGIDETDRIWPQKPMNLTFKRASAAQIYERINSAIMRRLRPGKTRVRKAQPGAESREMLCIQPEHNDPITRHSLQRKKSDTETWRCEACGHNTVIPRAV